MSTDFRIVALEAADFAPLFALDDAALRARGMLRVVADGKPGYPCRVSLVDAEPGETVLLLPYVHHDVEGPYRGIGPIYVRAGAATARPARNEIPTMLVHRLLSLRAYDADGMLLASDVTAGEGLEQRIRRFLADPHVHTLHVHNAKPGCYNCRVVRG